MVYDGKYIYKWMMTGGTPIYGNPRMAHTVSYMHQYLHPAEHVKHIRIMQVWMITCHALHVETHS